MKTFSLIPNILFSISLMACQTDKDGDGFVAPEDPDSIKAGEDCNDNDDDIGNPSEEVCDDIDNDCDGDIDEGVRTTFYLDRDGDGYGSAVALADDELEAVLESCFQPAGYVLTTDDCDDQNASVHPFAVEVCDELGLDEDCDGSNEDEDALGQTDWFPDVDVDGFGDDVSGATTQCYAPDSFVSIQGDCDDAMADVNSNMEEITGDTGNVDEDCDGFILCYIDADRDGYGSGDPVSVPSDTNCAERTDEGFDGTHTYSRISTDCDDTDAFTHPLAAYEEPGAFCMRDSDGDGFGDANLEVSELSDGLVAGTDCNDTTNAVSPNTAEIPANGVDENCNTEELCFVNSDNDGFGSTLPPISSTNFACDGDFESDNQLDCDDNDVFTYPGAAENEATPLDTYCTKDEDGDGYADQSVANTGVFAGTDCDDDMSMVNTAMDERCDTSYDDNCDGLVNDVTSVDVLSWFTDSDGDGFGDADAAQIQACSEQTGFVAIDGDCDDANDGVYPGALEDTAFGGDQNCDGYEACFVDGDGDGYGSSQITYSLDTSCSGSIESNNSEDCDDSSAETFPGAASLETNATLCMADTDGDGYGDVNPVITDVVSGTDCNDGNSSISPDAQEIPADGVDGNCNNIELCYQDADGDTFGTLSGTTVVSEDLVCTDLGEAVNQDDCDDLSTSIKPSALELCNGIDDDCDGSVDEGTGVDAPADAPMWYVDADLDGYGGIDISLQQCDQPSGFVADALDCQDLDSTISPNATEVCFDGLDNDCDDVIDGSSSCVKSATTASATLIGDLESEMAGASIDVGDVDGDGLMDLLVGAPGAGDGVAYLMYGPVGYDRDLETQYDVKFVGVATDSDGTLGFGKQVALVDLNGNGRKDIVASAPADDSTGIVYVLHSTQTNRWSGEYSMAGIADAVLDGRETDTEFGCALENGGDMDGDGYQELLLGTCNATESMSGFAAVLYGQVDNLDGDYEVDRNGVDASLANITMSFGIFEGLNQGDAFGSVLGVAGDLNNDGLTDVLIAAPTNYASDDGSIYLLYGDDTQFDGLFTVSDMSAFTNGELGMQHGGSVGAAGDVNGDGFDDFWVGAPASRTHKGYVELYLGANTELSGEITSTAIIVGSTDNDRFGEAIQSIGDVNMDGYDDVAVSSSGDSNIGSVHFFYGPLSGTIDLGGNDESSGLLSGDSMGQGLNSNFGSQMFFGDLNANGSADLIVGASRDDSGSVQDAGAVFVFGSIFE